jgi:undecaprenyl diphosphate synthase
MMKDSSYHIGIILDGNGRWAKNHNKPRLFGHKTGSRNVRKVVGACIDLQNIHALTIYAFAIANWRRDENEVTGLWEIFRHFFKSELEHMYKLGVSIRMIGDRTGVPKDVLVLIKKAEAKSKENKQLILQVALNYDGVDEVVRATKKITQQVCYGEVSVSNIDATLLHKNLDTAGIPNPDIIIRTGMEQSENKTGMTLWCSSSFLQLQSAQAVCVSTPVLWPDFSPEDLEAAIVFAKPDERLFGGQRR